MIGKGTSVLGSRKTAVFTIVSNNYLAYACTLMDSLSTVHPEWSRYVLIVDIQRDEIPVPEGLFDRVYVQDLPLPALKKFAFRYSIMEFNTAVKPWMFEHLLERGNSNVVYLDPDIWVINPLVALQDAWRTGTSITLTPHLTAPIDDGRRPNELDILRSGSFNLGFVAVSDSAVTRDMLGWWKQKLEFQAASDLAKGLFTDQKWIDLVPGMFDGVSILRDPGYNVAYWNLSHRPVVREKGEWRAGGQLLRFFHFSGIDPENPEAFSKHQDRFRLSTIGETEHLALDYCKTLLRWNHAELRKYRYAFGQFSDGVAIPDALRAFYRDSFHLQALGGEDPFLVRERFSKMDSTGLSPVATAVWRARYDLQLAFPRPFSNDRKGYVDWFVGTAKSEMGIAEEFIEPFKEWQTADAPAGLLRVSNLPPHDPYMPIWGTIIWQAHLWLAPAPSQEELRLYRRVDGPVQFVRVALRQFWELYKFRVNWLRDLIAPKKVPIAKFEAPRPRTVEISSPIIAGGLYPAEGRESPWVGSGFRLQLKGTLARLKVKGVHQAANFERAHGSPELEVQVTINSSSVGSFTLRNEGEFSVSVPIATGGDGGVCVLGLKPVRTFVPMDLGINDDERELSFQLESLVLNDQLHLFGHEMAIVTNVPQEKSREQTPIREQTEIGINLVGYLRSEHGVGESARLCANSMAAVHLNHCLIDFNVGNSARTQDNTFARRFVEHPKYSTNLYHINADQMPLARESFGGEFFAGRYNVGYWAWELPEFPDEWTGAFNLVNEVWVPSLFVQESIAKKAPIPVIRVPHSIRFSVSKTVSRADFGIPDRKAIFLVMYDYSSYQERKNPKAALAAFEKAFPVGSQDVVLVIKTQNSHQYPEKRKELRDWIGNRANVVWIDRTLDRQTTYELISVCDFYVSLHRSEGFGIVIAEAMYLGKPVIATNWSGNRDFLDSTCGMPVNYEIVRIEEDIGVYKAGQSWAEPDIDHAAALMRKLLGDSSLRARISNAASRRVREALSPEVVGTIIRQRTQVWAAAAGGNCEKTVRSIVARVEAQEA
jgi:glycosyltransferase involved in cell wall biosynthesis